MHGHRHSGCSGERHARGDWGGRHFGGRHRMRGGWRGGRVFDHGDLRLLVLQLVAEKPRHGYELIKAIEERLGGSYTPSPGVVYPTPTMLAEPGYAPAPPPAGCKKLYTVTPEGTALLDANRPAVAAVLHRFD